MSARWTLDLSCDGWRCDAVFRGKVGVDRAVYGRTLVLIREAAATVGWTHSHGTKNRSVDFCRSCSAMRRGGR